MCKILLNHTLAPGASAGGDTEAQRRSNKNLRGSVTPWLGFLTFARGPVKRFLAEIRQ